MSSDNDRCFQCQETSRVACYCPHIQCFDCNKYGHIAMDCPDRHHNHTRCSCHDYKDRPRFSRSQSHSHNHGYRSSSHHIATAVTHQTADLHPIEIFPKMTVDLNYTNPKNSITSQHKDPPQAHEQHHGKIETEDTNKSQLMIHYLNTTVPMIKIVTPRMI